MYLAENEIAKIKKKGKNVIVSFVPIEDQKIDDILTSQEYVDEMQSEESLDAGEFAHKEKLLLSEQMYELLLKHNVKIERLPKILEHIIYSVNTNEQKFTASIIGKDYIDRTFLDIKT